MKNRVQQIGVALYIACNMLSGRQQTVTTFTIATQSRIENFHVKDLRVWSAGYLLPYIVVGGVEELHKTRDGSLFDTDMSMLRGSRGNVGERPCCLKLQGWSLPPLEELDKPWDNPNIDNLLDRRISLCK